MRVFDLLTMLDAEIRPEKTKVHLASNNGFEDPLDLYRVEQFPKWQRWQSRRNFERSFVVALIQMPEPNKWLFAGAYTSIGCKPDGEGFQYDLEERPMCREIDGRLIVNFHRSGRQAYLKGEGWVDQILVHEIRAEKLSVPEFPGFKGLHISKGQLDLSFERITAHGVRRCRALQVST